MSDDQGPAEAIEEFLFQMAANGRRPSSVSSYTRELQLLQRWLGARPLASITASDVSRFLALPPVRLRRDGRERRRQPSTAPSDTGTFEAPSVTFTSKIAGSFTP